MGLMFGFDRNCFLGAVRLQRCVPKGVNHGSYSQSAFMIMSQPVPSNVCDLPGHSSPSFCDLKDALTQTQSDIEAEKAVLVRALHDDLGGLLVGAIMDIGWISQQAGHSLPVKEKLARATGLLRAAIDMKRKLIENLRPTLLDNVGLFSTLRWHTKTSCGAAGVAYLETYPSSEMIFASDVKIGVFRIFQEALKHVLSESDGALSKLSVEVEVIDNTLHCRLKSEPLVPGCAPLDIIVSPATSMYYRAQRIGGTLRWLKTGSGNHIEMQIPFTPLLEPRLRM